MALTTEAVIALVGVLLGLPAVAVLFWKAWRWLRTDRQPGTAQGKLERSQSHQPFVSGPNRKRIR